jgi:hypothetical protein
MLRIVLTWKVSPILLVTLLLNLLLLMARPNYKGNYMIEFKNLKFGDKVCVVDKTCNAFTKNKIKMIDEDGIEWFRYDRDNWEYNIKELEYCGRVTFTEEGSVRFSENRLDEYHFLWPDGQIYAEYLDDDHEIWFYSENEAKEYMLSCIENDKQ